MGITDQTDPSFDERMAGRLRGLRTEQGWSLDDLATRCGVSRATLSRLENAEVSPTASVLGKLCATYGMTLSRLMALVETDFVPLVPREKQVVWEDPETGLQRRNVSPPARTLSAEVLHCDLPAGQRIDYPDPPHAGLEHHLYLLEGFLEMTIDGRLYQLGEGDCLRYRLCGPSAFETPKDRAAKYILVIL
jgi:transcriptional regulator with XRE-family HTH domain